MSSSPGIYSLVAGITGTSNGAAFTRQSLTEMEVIAATGKLTGSISDQGVDDNGDGLFERIAFTVGTNTTVAANYQAFVHLKAANGKSIVGSGSAALASGAGAITVDVRAETLREANENWPYTIELVEFISVRLNI